jgi:Tol biopolymer transport system component/DNA-binding winged helix-turn-helix (wHTH) protein
MQPGLPNLPQHDEEALNAGGIVIHLTERHLTKEGVRINLSGVPLEVLLYLASQHGRLVPKTDLERSVWGGRANDDTIYQHIRAIRLATGVPDVVTTVRGKGYQLNPSVTVISPAAKAVEAPERKPGRNIHRWIIPALGAFCLIVAGLLFAVRTQDRPIAVGPPIRVTNSRVSKLSPLITDGSVIYFTKTESGKYFVVCKPVSGGDEETLPISVPNPYVCAISKDKQRLLVRSVVGEFDDLGPFFIVTIPTLEARRLGTVIGFDGQWSPAEDMLAISHDHDLLLLAADGSQIRKATTVTGNIWWPRWSSDGKRIRFTVNEEGTQVRSLWEISLSTVVPHRLFADGKRPFINDCCGTWVAKDRFYVFQTSSKAELSLWAISEGNSLRFDKPQAVPLVSGFRGPVSSPDGATLFARHNILNVEAVQVNLRDGDYHSIFPDVSGFTALSPDRNWLVYSGVPEDRLTLRDLRSRQQREIVAAPYHAVAPTWSPNGTRVAFARRTIGDRWRVCVFTLGTGEVREILSGGSNQIDPSWFPDNRRIAFGGIPTISEQDPLARQIRIVDIENGSLTSLAAPETVYKPVVSPDGQMVAALASPSQHLVLYDFGTKIWRQATDEPVAFPVWSADGRIVYCGIKSQVVAVRIRDFSRKPVLDMDRIGIPPTYGRWIDRQPDGSLVLFRDISVNDFYSFKWGGER